MDDDRPDDDVEFDRRKAGSLFLRVLEAARPYRRQLAACIFGSVLAAAIEVFLPQVMRYAIDHYILNLALPKPERIQGALRLSGLYLGLLAMSAVMGYLITIKLQEIGQRTVQEIRRRLFAQLHRLPMTFFDRNPVGRLVVRVCNDTGTLADLFSGVLANLLSDVLKFCAIWVALFVSCPSLTGALLCMAPPLWIITRWYQRRGTAINRQIRYQVGRINAFLQENLQGYAILKAYVAEARQARRFAEKNDEYLRTEMQLVFLYATFRPVFHTASQVALVLVILQGGTLTLQHQLSVGSLVSFLFYLKMLFAPLDDLAEKLNAFQGATVAAERIFGILDTPAEPSGASRAEGRGQIVFEHVSFAYDPEKPVLRDVSFTIEPGQSVALVGPTGSGKTTITALLQRFYALEQGGTGSIRLDGLDVREWDVEALRARFGTVQQDLFLFRASLERNLKLFRDIDEDDFQRALAVSRGVQVLERYPQGRNLELGERGQQLSQGERQLLSFARALVDNPPILILDEATASIDSVTEDAIQAALTDLLRGRTALVVAHRLSTIRQCDLILVLDHGRLIEQGNHGELMARDGLYARLYETQMLA